jgi:predicted TIM-barrel fold metal-dependent hydrolase
VRDYRIISVDDHLVQPPDLWTSRLPAHLQERAPRIVEGAGGDLKLFLSRFNIETEFDETGSEPVAGDAWVYDGNVFPTTGASVVGARPMLDIRVIAAFRYRDLPPEFVDPVARTKAMDADGVLASLCFPMSEFPRFCGQTFLEADDKDLALLCVRAYNDYVIDEWAAAAPGRFIPLIILPLWDTALAVAEIERSAAKGARAIAFSENPSKLGLGSVHSHDWDAVFAAAQDAELPLCTHIGSGSWVPTGSPDAPFTVGLANTTTLSTLTAYDWLLSDVFERFPKLKLVLSEGGIGWLPHVLEHGDYVWERHGTWTGGKAPKPPSEYFATNVYGCFIDDIFGAAHIREIGIDNVMLETDYPHADSSWPNTMKMAEARLAYLTDDELEKVTRANAERIFHFKPATP